MATGKMAKSTRRCWWCNGFLMAATHAVIKTRDGYEVRVHHACAPNAKKQEGTTGEVLSTDSTPVHPSNETD